MEAYRRALLNDALADITPTPATPVYQTPMAFLEAIFKSIDLSGGPEYTFQQTRSHMWTCKINLLIRIIGSKAFATSEEAQDNVAGLAVAYLKNTCSGRSFHAVAVTAENLGQGLVVRRNMNSVFAAQKTAQSTTVPSFDTEAPSESPASSKRKANVQMGDVDDMDGSSDDENEWWNEG